MQQQPGNWLTTLIPFVIIAVVLALRMKSMSKERPLKVDTVWVVPVIYLALVGFMLFSLPPPPLGWGLMGAGLAIGAAIGWHPGQAH
jgi:amino acid transporter